MKPVPKLAGNVAVSLAEVATVAQQRHQMTTRTTAPSPAVTEPIRKLWAADETAEWLGVSKRGLYRLVREGRVPVVNVGRFYRFNPAELARWLERGGVK